MSLVSSFLPDEILLQILRLLPFESILACKRVCKQWHTLIKDPKFSKDYHHNGSLILLHDKLHLYCILTSPNNEISRHPSYSVHRITEGSGVLQFKPALLSGWSNGVACVKAANGYFHLYNLFTGVSHTVEDVERNLGFGYDRYDDDEDYKWIYCGFGYDRYDDDYKIVVVYDYEILNLLREYKENRSDGVQNKENSLFWVYSSRNRCWKSFDGFPYAAYYWKSFSVDNLCSFNGVLHCAVEKLFDKKWVIVTYDLHTCRFGEISVPEDDIFRCMLAKAIELDGELCYAYLLRDKWVAEVYDDVGGSWAQRFSVAHSPSPSDRASSYYGLTYMALYELRDGREVGLFISGQNLVWYDFSNDEMEMIAASTAWEQRQLVQQLSKAKISVD